MALSHSHISDEFTLELRLEKEVIQRPITNNKSRRSKHGMVVCYHHFLAKSWGFSFQFQILALLITVPFIHIIDIFIAVIKK